MSTGPSHFNFHEHTSEDRALLAKEFRAASPFPHLVLHDVINTSPDTVLAAFPEPEWHGWSLFQDDYQTGKMFCQDLTMIPDPFRSMIHELHAPAFLRFLEDVTEIEGLIPDPYLQGGGLHCSGTGGILVPHTDFHVYRRLRLYRRLNVLLYLNPGWREDDGGALELWEGAGRAPVKAVAPDWGTCVIFETDTHSVHGFSTPVTPRGGWRRSIALYFYTSEDTDSFGGDANTYWRPPRRLTGGRRLRYALHDALLIVARGISFLAHRVDPHLGSRSRPRR